MRHSPSVVATGLFVLALIVLLLLVALAKWAVGLIMEG